MKDTSQWLGALLIGIPTASLLTWFIKSGFDFEDSFEQKTEIRNK